MGDLSPELEDEYFIWRLVVEKVTTLAEVTYWDLEQVCKANSILDMNRTHESAYNEFIRKRNEKK